MLIHSRTDHHSHVYSILRIPKPKLQPHGFLSGTANQRRLETRTMKRLLSALTVTSLCFVAVEGNSQQMERCFESVLLLGDSNVYGALGHSLQSDFQARGSLVFREGKPGSGLARPDFHDWPSEARMLVDIVDPDLVVIMLGGNDIQRIRDQRGRFADGIAWEDRDRWETEYGNRIGELVDGMIAARPESRKRRRRVVFLSPTNRRPKTNRERVKRIVALQRAHLGGRTDVRWIDAFKLTSNQTGRYLASGYRRDGRVLRYRHGDGIHFTRAGADDLASRLRSILYEGCPQSAPVNP